MKLFLRLLALLCVLQFSECIAQHVEGDINKFISGPDDVNWANGDSAQQLFYNLNKERIQGLMDAFSMLPIDRCRHYLLQIQIGVDKDGKLQQMRFIKKSEFVKTDSTITSMLKLQPGKWKMPYMSNSDNLFWANLSFYMLNDYTKRGHSRTESYYFITTVESKSQDPQKSCQDAEYYYDNGLKFFNDGNFKKALAEYEKAILVNPYDVDALYNLAITHYKMGNKADACNWMKKAAEYDVTIDEATIEKVCSK
jgi:tetratricopeptide (TPR) repeat protein